MALTARSIDVKAPLQAVYDQWTRFEEFPLFMEGVEEVRLESEKFLLWKVKMAGRIKNWEAEITNQSFEPKDLVGKCGRLLELRDNNIRGTGSSMAACDGIDRVRT
jgi:hypothetical protein